MLKKSGAIQASPAAAAKAGGRAGACRARDMGLLGCHVCGLVSRSQGDERALRCPQCHSVLHSRVPNSLARTWALLLTAMILYIPANLLPMMETTYLGEVTTDTIISGVLLFIEEGDWLVAGIIFSASIVIPILKMASLLYLLISVHKRCAVRKRQRALLYRVTELVGRWSMVDVFVVGLLTALVHMGLISNIYPGMGIMAFAGVVILTMLAALSFDSRLIWDFTRDR